MLFPYKYVPHQMEKMQSFINFIFYQVWCRAPKTKSAGFSLDLFDANPNLRKVMQDFYFSTSAGAEDFYKNVHAIYNLFSDLNRKEIAQLKRWYQGNNNIEEICANDPSIHIVRYADIEAIYPKLSKQLASFFKGLYSKDLLNLVALREKIGQIDDHYHEFMKVNEAGKCPFCGISDIFGVYHSKREAYDHYLPKGIYPFNSINFRNLVPACHHCNSSYKLTQDPAFTPKDPVGKTSRRKVFYPYADPSQKIEITIDLSKSNVNYLTPSDVQFTFGPSAINEEIETWKDVYGIEERYKAKCCSCDAKDWLEQVRIFRDEYNIEPEVTLATVRKQSERDPIANSNFLKVAFLEGCHRIGMWNSSL